MFSTVAGAAAGAAMRWLRSGVAQVQTVAVTSRDKLAPTLAPSIERAEDQSAPDVSRFAPGGEQFLQPDQTTCGSSSLVMAKMINSPVVGEEILDPGPDGGTDVAAVTQRFADAVLAMHRTTGGWKDSGGAWQLPWPTQLGTPPWTVAREMTAVGGSGRPGSKYAAHLINPMALETTYEAIVAAVDRAECVPLFIGDSVMARHVVLVTGLSAADAVGHVSGDDDALSIYDPSAGEWVSAARRAYVTGNIGVAGWSQPWFVVTPS